MIKEIMENINNETAPKRPTPDRQKPSLRRKIANTLSVLFMGASSTVGCTLNSSPKGESDSSSSTSPQVSVETNPDIQSETSIPAPMSTEEGSSIEIKSSSYPSNEENFILNDQRTNQEKIEIIKSVAPDDYQKEADLLGEEWGRMGRDGSDLEIVASVVDGKSWVLVAKSKSGGQVFVPRINGIIQASLHLFGRLDEAGDFFDLVPVAMEGATVVGDGSGWHVVARVEDGEVSEWYDATRDEVRTVEAGEPSPTPDARFKTLVPETLDEAMENNVIHFENFGDDFSKYIGKIKEGLDEGEKGSDYSTSIFSGSVGAPGGWGLDIDEAEIKGIGALVMPNGDELVLLTYLLGRDDYGPERALVTLCVDPEASKNYLENTKLSEESKALADLESNYTRIIENKTDVGAAIIIGFFEGQERGIWSNLYDVYDAQPVLHTDTEERGLQLRFLSPAMQELEGRSEQASEMEKVIIPVIDIFFYKR